MKVGNHTVAYTFRPARIISDVVSLAMAAFSFISAASFTSAHPEIKTEFAKTDLTVLWSFPAVCAAIILIYAILTLRSPRYEKYSITKDNAQSVFEWYVFELSLCKLPLLVSAAEAELIFEERLMGGEKSFFSVTFILCALILVIIIRLSKHRITSLTKTNNKAGGKVFVKAEVIEDGETSGDAENEREKK